MIKTILVPTDFTSTAELGESFAVMLAKKTAAEIILFHHINMPDGWSEMTKLEKASFPESNERVRSAKEKLERKVNLLQNENVKTVSLIGHGNLVKNIEEFVALRQVDFVIMGSHGAGGVEEWVIGSNAQRVVRTINCPVVIIKNPFNKPTIKNLIFASNFNIEAKKAFLKVADLARLFNATLHIITIQKPTFFTVPRIILKTSMSEFRKLAPDVNCILYDIADINIEKGLKSMAEEIDADLITISTYGRGKISRIFVGSIAEALVNHIERPVMTLNIQDSEPV